MNILKTHSIEVHTTLINKGRKCLYENAAEVDVISLSFLSHLFKYWIFQERKYMFSLLINVM